MAPVWFCLLLAAILSESNGLRLRVASVPAEPFYSKRPDGTYQGFLVDLLAELLQRDAMAGYDEVNYRLYEDPDGKYGQLNSRGEWDGLIGQLVRGDADMALAPLTMTQARSEAVLFSHPFMSALTVPLVLQPEAGQKVPFSDLNDLVTKVQAGNLSVVYVGQGSTETFLRNHKMPQVSLLYNLTSNPRMPDPTVPDYNAGVQRVRGGGGRVLFYGEHPSFDYFMLRNCDVAVAWQGNVGIRHYALAFSRSPSGNDWLRRFNHLLLAAEEDGTIMKLQHRWWSSKSFCHAPPMCRCTTEVALENK